MLYAFVNKAVVTMGVTYEFVEVCCAVLNERITMELTYTL